VAPKPMAKCPASKISTTSPPLKATPEDFPPRGISIVAPDSLVESIRSWRSLLEPYGIHRFSQGYAGADINQLPGDETVLIGLRPDSHRYFEVHHSARDVLAQVNARELEMGSATLASLLYLLDYYDLGDPL